MTVSSSVLRAPFPWYGGKSRVADQVWSLLGTNVGRYIEPFAGSLAVLLNRPAVSGLEVANDADGYVVNVWRSLKHCPQETLSWADWPRTEHDLTSRHLWLVNEGRAILRGGLRSDPEWHDPRVAGWWLYGIAMWIGTGWCRGDGPWTRERLVGDAQLPHLGDDGQGVHAQLPHLGNDGQGVHAQLPHLGNDGRGVHAKLPHLGNDGRGVHAKLPHLGDDGQGVINQNVRSLCEIISRRLQRVLITCGDFERVLTDSAMRSTSGITGVFLDPPYRQHTDEYCTQDDVESVWQRLTAWCETNGPRSDLRIVLCGYEGDWDAPAGWETIAYTGRGTSSANRTRERMWASPSCTGAMSLFGDGA